MFLRIWNYFRGYVMINVSGFSVERFVNLAANRGIFIWDLEHKKDSVNMKVSVKGFKSLRPCAQKTKCKIRIIEKQGLPFRINKLGKRKFFLAGVICFITVLFFLSSFVWTINVAGNNRVSSEKIFEFLNEQGIKAGMLRKDLDTKALTEQMLLNFSDISFVSFKINGTNLDVSIVETINATDSFDKNTPVELVSKKSGVVYNIVVRAGTPLVKTKDVVEKGDVLVSSEIVALAEGNPVKSSYVHADAEVYAKVWYVITSKVPLKYTEREYTGKRKKHYEFTCFSKSFKIEKAIKFENFDVDEKLYSYKFLGDVFFPFSLKVYSINQYNLTYCKRDIKEAIELSNENINLKIDEEFDVDTQIVDKKLEYSNDGNTLTCKATIAAIERIDEKREYKGEIITRNGDNREES